MAAAAAKTKRESLHYEASPSHLLHNLVVWHLGATTEDDSRATSNALGYWLIFIHGGAWRDPRDTADDFAPAVEGLLRSRDVSRAAIAGFASIDYRLSPHPDFPEEAPSAGGAPVGGRDQTRRTARHPDHIKDVWLALEYLERALSLQGRYILVGHSAGATLAMQLLMGSPVLRDRPFHYGLPCQDLDETDPAFQYHCRHHKEVEAGKLPLGISSPAGVIGIAGIYDFRGLNTRTGGAYTGIFSGAFGSDEQLWDDAAPVSFRGSFADAFPSTRQFLLAWSPEDEYIDEPEIDAMAAALRRDGLHCHVVKDINGSHDFAWQDGGPIVRLVEQLLGELGDHS